MFLQQKGGSGKGQHMHTQQWNNEYPPNGGWGMICCHMPHVMHGSMLQYRWLKTEGTEVVSPSLPLSLSMIEEGGDLEFRGRGWGGGGVGKRVEMDAVQVDYLSVQVIPCSCVDSLSENRGEGKVQQCLFG